jgi:hypothetical protein
MSNENLEAVIAFLRKLAAERFFGTVELKYQSGGIVQVLQHVSYKTHDLPARPDDRNNYGDTSRK